MSRRSRSDVIGGLVRAWRASRLQTDLMDDAAFQKLGINRTDGRCLDALSDGPVTAAILAQACGVTPNALTTVVDRLIARGLVERVSDPDDRRRVLIRLTKLAGHVSQQLYGPITEQAVASFGKYTIAELEMLEAFMNQSREFQARHTDYIRSLELDWGTSRHR